MANEVVIAERWLFETLSSDDLLSSFGIFSYLVPFDAPYPVVFFAPYQVQSDTTTINAWRIKANFLYVVKAITQGTTLMDVQDAAARIDELLHRQRGALILSCVRWKPLAYPEQSDGIEYRHLGGIYKLEVQSG